MLTVVSAAHSMNAFVVASQEQLDIEVSKPVSRHSQQACHVICRIIYVI